MAFCRLVFPLLVLSVVSATTVPVFLWGDLPKTSFKSNPLSTTREKFTEILKDELQNDPYFVVFIEESLSPEDFSSRNNGESSFPYLQSKLGDAVYFPSVDDAVHVLNEVAGKAVHVTLTESGLTEVIEDENNQALFISLKDAKEGESRYEMLSRHDDFIKKEFSKIQKDNKVALYTARNPSWTIPDTHSRMRRQTEENSVSTADYALDGVRLYSRQITVSTGNTTTVLNGYTPSPSEFNTTSMNATMTFAQATLTLNFHQAAGYWFFDTVTLRQNNPSVMEELYPTSEVYALVDFSYRCKQFVSFTSINETTQYTVSFEDMKIQPFFGAINETQAFGDSFNCVGFFSAPIWAGLFVVFILLAIMFYGIMMMMDIRTMDRFDDPKGKTITINTAE